MKNYTRGSGLLEQYLSQRRYKLIKNFLKDVKFNNSVLDLGCGTYPYILSKLKFDHKYGIDKHINIEQLPSQINYINLDFSKINRLPFDDNSIEIVISTAVIEHLNYITAKKLISEAYRVLKPGGILLLTTPAKWTDPLLRIMANFNFVSQEEIDEHVCLYNKNKLHNLLEESGYQGKYIKIKFFECFMNLFAISYKDLT